MFKLAAAVIGFLITTPSWAQQQPYSYYLNAQFGSCSGQCGGSGLAQCTNHAAMPYWQCIHPRGATGFVGTVTVKRPNVEILMGVVCDGLVVWAGERVMGTSDLNIKIPAVVDSCYVYWGEGSSAVPAPNADFEYQLVFH